MSSGPKQQHFVPKVYLKPWCYQRKKSLICYVSSKEEIEWHPHDTGSIMKENEIYTIFSEDGVKDKRWESWMSKLENEYEEVRNRLEKDVGLMTPGNFETLARFVSAQIHRTPHMRKKLRKFLSDISKIYASPNGGSIPFLFRPGSKIYHPEELKAATANKSSPMTYILLPEINSLFSEIKRMNVSFIEDHTSAGFITSDNPVVILNHYPMRPAIHEWSITAPNTQIIFPVSPKLCTLFSWKRKPNLNSSITPDITHRCNNLIYSRADKWIVSSSKNWSNATV